MTALRFSSALTTVIFCITWLVASVFAATNTPFGFLDNGVNWTISTGAGLTITMHQPTCDMTSILVHGQEVQIPTNGSYINSGLQWNGAVTSHIANFTDSDKDMLQITCEMTGLTQYFFLRANENNVYMGTEHTPEMSLPELRFVALLSIDGYNSAARPCIMDDGVPIESADIVLVGNETRSKFYSAVPFIDDNMHGVTGPAGAVYTVHPPQAYETSIGGPFFRDINLNVRNNRSEVTFYMNSDHSRTEAYRYGFHGPYALAFTNGGKPTNYDDSFFQRLDLPGFVKQVDRGTLVGLIYDPNRVLDSYPVVVHFFNADAQYWTRATRSKAIEHAYQYASPLMKPGNYTTLVYRNEFVVANTTFSVTKGEASTSDLAISFNFTAPLWRIGNWDGTPEGFMNGNKIYKMHPSDLRMVPWSPVNFTIGTNTSSQFPMALFRAINDPIRILFSLTAEQATTAHTLRIGVTVEFYSARPSVLVNDVWKGPSQTTHALSSRSITRGVTHGNYFIYEFAIPATAFQKGSNSVQLGITSGKVDSTGFLHASLAFDALELI